MKLLIEVNEKIVTIRNEKVILDSDVAELYGVPTNDINQAVKRNPDKFPEGYIIRLTDREKEEVATNCGNLRLKFSPVLPNAFTERGLYMLATILKSPQATQTTISIIEAFTKLRELSAAVQVAVVDPTEANQQMLAEKSSNILSDILDHDMHPTDSETSIELNLALLKVKHTVRRKHN